jgi:hypothetical protein
LKISGFQHWNKLLNIQPFMAHASSDNSPFRWRTCGSTWPYRLFRILRAMWCVVGWGCPVCRTGTRGPVRPASIRHQAATRSSGREPTFAASPPGGAGTHQTGASQRRLGDCHHGTPATISSK